MVDREQRVFIPNSFSPNGDGFNDQFMIFAGSDVRIIRSFKVFNRWGAALYTANDFSPNDTQFGWDGEFQGQIVNSGVYIYFAEIEFVDGRTEIFRGDLTITR